MESNRTIADSTDINEICNVITDTAKQVNEFHSKHGSDSAYDAWDPNAPSVPSETRDIRKAREATWEAASALTRRVASPLDSILNLLSEFQKSSALRCAIKFKFVHAVPLEGSASYTEVGEKVGLDTKSVQRIVAPLVASGVFCHVLPDRVIHSRLSHLMATDTTFESFTGMCFDDSYLAIASLADSLEKWGPSGEPTETGFNIGSNSTMTFWKYLESNPQIQERFSDAMTYMSSDFEFTRHQSVENFDWVNYGDATVIDIGGSSGQVSMIIAEEYPDLKFIVQDYEETCKQGEEALPSKFRDRISFQAHDMFSPQTPIPDKKVIYLLSSVLHDWSDKYACKILQAILSGMKPGDRIIPFEQLVPEPGTAGSTRESVSWGCDISMWALYNGQERSATQYRALAKLASPKLKVVSILPASPFMSAVEIALEDT